MNNREIDEYVDSRRRESNAYIIILNHTFLRQKQKGGTCGYYAMSIVTAHWHGINKDYPFFYARKSDSLLPNAEVVASQVPSLRQIGKSKIPTMDAIFSVYSFSDVLNDIDYKSSVYDFDTLFDFSIIINKSLEGGFPIILPVDLGITLSGGSKAHYVTLIGLIRNDDGACECIITSDNKYYRPLISDLFDSCMNLEAYSGKKLIKINKSWVLDLGNIAKEPDTRRCIIPRTTLENMKGKLVIAYPSSYEKSYQSLNKDITKSLMASRSARAALKRGTDISLSDETGMSVLSELISMKVKLTSDMIRLFSADNMHHFISHPDVTSEPHRYIDQSVLYFAVQTGNREMILLLTKKISDINCRFSQSRFNTALHMAICLRKFEIARLLIDIGARLDITNGDGKTALHLAIEYYNTTDNDEILYISIDEQNINVVDKSGKTPLFKAIENADIGLDFIHCLLENGANPNEGCSYASTLYWAIQQERDIEIIGLLIRAGADLYATTSTRDKFTPLHLAIKSEKMEVATLLLSHRMNIDSVATGGKTPLHCYFENEQIKPLSLEFLLKNGANINVTDDNGRTPLYCVVESEYSLVTEKIKILLANGADINKANNIGQTPLHIAIKNYRSDTIVQLLVDNGADLNAIDNRGMTPLELSYSCGHANALSLLKNKKNNITAAEKAKKHVFAFWNEIDKKSLVQHELPSANLGASFTP